MKLSANLDNQESLDLLQKPEVQRLLSYLSLAEQGFVVISIFSPETKADLLALIENQFTQNEGKSLVINQYVIPEISASQSDQKLTDIYEGFKQSFWKWLNETQLPADLDQHQSNLFVIDGSNIQANNRTNLIDHFSFMNGPRDKIAGNKRGPFLIFLPQSLNISSEIEKYSDLMSCCNGRYQI